jgi:hypothetical protein
MVSEAGIAKYQVIGRVGGSEAAGSETGWNSPDWARGAVRVKCPRIMET